MVSSCGLLLDRVDEEGGSGNWQAIRSEVCSPTVVSNNKGTLSVYSDSSSQSTQILERHPPVKVHIKIIEDRAYCNSNSDLVI